MALKQHRRVHPPAPVKLLAEKCDRVLKVNFLAKMGPAGARAPKPYELLSFLEPPGSPNGPKVHFFAKSALFRIPGSREVVKTTVFIPTFDMGAKSETFLVQGALLRKVRFQHFRVRKYQDQDHYFSRLDDFGGFLKIFYEK